MISKYEEIIFRIWTGLHRDLLPSLHGRRVLLVNLDPLLEKNGQSGNYRVLEAGSWGMGAVEQEP